jgi:class 3 adenylate cyclase/alpha-beta hydrolase superfamily lysophospholipase
VQDPPRTRYAKTADGVHIAYQVVGDGSRDLVFVPGLVNHLDFMWQDRNANRFFSRLAEFSRLILFDKRGTGLSDRDVESATLEDRIDDVRTVMEATHSKKAALLGYSEGGPMSILFAATHPDRISALILAESFAKPRAASDYPEGNDPFVVEDLARLVDEDWGSGASLKYFAPALMDHPKAREAVGAWERMAGSPSAVLATLKMIGEIDLRPLLPSVQVPTLILQRKHDRINPPSQGRYLADHIPNARYVEQEGDAHILWLGDTDAFISEIEEFLTGVRRAPEPERVLATLLFSDIVGSTSRAAELGDRRWRSLLDTYDETLSREIERFQGRRVKTMGDGTMAIFDGPTRSIRCAYSIRGLTGQLGLQVRIGLHTGEIVPRGDDVGGIAVHTAARIQALAQPGELLLSRTVVDLVAGSGIEFEDRGEHELKGVPGTWRLFAVQG